ncbi:hypothetical protein AB4144_37805, partial [Rhizobiaceae sp. 2RAB30]
MLVKAIVATEYGSCYAGSINQLGAARVSCQVWAASLVRPLGRYCRPRPAVPCGRVRAEAFSRGWV